MKLDNVADIYPLSPLQLGMLYHTLAEPASGVYVQQLAIRLRGPLDSSALLSAWSAVTNRNTILRTVFLWDGLDEPVQVVRQQVDIPWKEDDWSDLGPEAFRGRLDAFLEADRRDGFDPARAPLFRLCLIHSKTDECFLVWSYHHILLDGWSTDIVLHELRSVYAAELAAQDYALPEPRPYREYIDHLQHVDRAASEDFWKGYLGDFHEPTPLGVDRPAGHSTNTGVRTADFNLSAELTGRLSLFARKNRVTMNTVVHAAWSLLLGLYANRQDLVYGFTITHRPPELHDSQRMVGLFINTLPVRVRLDPGSAINEWIQTLQGSLLDIQSHGQTPLFEAKRLSAVSSDRPLFESLLVFENYPAQRDSAPGALDILDVDHLEQSNFPLALLILPGDRMQILVVYDPSRFEDEAIPVLLGQFSTVLDQMTSDDSTLVGDVQLPVSDLSILHGSTGGRTVHPLHRQILDTASDRPDATAVVCDDRELSYSELSRKSASIAARLASYGLERGEPVCLVLNRTVDMITAILGVLRAGGAYVPIDPDAPHDRIQHLVIDCGARLLIENNGTGPGFDNPAVTTIVVEEVEDDTTSYTDPDVSPSDRAYIMYTSGSTGQPKGVEVTHENLSASTAARADYYQDSPESFLLLSSYVFDSSVAGIFGTLCAGGRLVNPRVRIEQDVDDLARLIHDQTITHTLCLPSLYRLVLEYADPQLLSSLRAVIVAGEQCPSSVIRRHFEVLPDVALHNEYGPTEATVWATVDRFDGPDADVTIGQPIPGVSVYVCGEDLRPLPRGVPGEILIGGPGVTRGYLNQPELTARYFISGIVGASSPRLYRTGDRGRVRPDGRLEFLGRIDGQLKIRGYRIEPEEIEAVLHQFESVNEAAVVAIPREEDDHSSLRLVAFYTTSVADGKSPVSTRDLKSFLSKRLPAHMVPAEYVQLDQHPRTATGKIDRLRLRLAPVPTAPVDGSTDQATQSREEDTLLEIWRKVLGNEDIQVTDNFFAVGGDSILSIEVTSLARRHGLTVSPHDVFETPTVRSLVARSVKDVRQFSPSQVLSGPTPLLPIHHWLVENHGGLPRHWNMSRLFDLPEGVGEAGLRAIASFLLRHHDALRGRIFEGEDGWRMENADAELDSVEVIDLSNANATDIIDSVGKYLEEAQRQIDPLSGRNTHFVMFRTAQSQRDLLLIVAHHAVVDVVSWRILQLDLDHLCRCVIESRDLHLPQRTTPMGTWSKVLQGIADSDALLDELPFWETQGREVTKVPRDSDEAVDNIEADAATFRQVVDFDVDMLLRLAAGADVRIHELLLAAITVALAEWMKSPKVLVGIEVHGRRQHLDPSIDLSRTVGWLTATYPLLFSAEPDRPLVDNISSVRDQMRQVPGQGLGYGVLRYLSPDPIVRKRLATTSQPEIIFNYLGSHDRPQVVGGVGLVETSNNRDRAPEANRPAIIEFGGRVVLKKLQVECRYNPKIHGPSTVTKLINRVRGLLVEFGSAGTDRLNRTGSADAARLSQDDFESLMRSLGG